MHFDQRSSKLSLIELLTVVAVLALAMAWTLPKIQVSSVNADRLNCAAHLRQIGIAWRQTRESGVNLTPELWPSQLSSLLGDDYRIFHCPSAKASPSFGMNRQAVQMHGGDGHKIVMLDYRRLVVDARGSDIAKQWPTMVAARHAGGCNVLRFDCSVDLRRPAEIDPTIDSNYRDWWQPHRAAGRRIDRH